MNNNDVVYFELNNWFAGKDYPNDEPFLSWMRNDLNIKFRNEKWVIENELCVVASIVDMSSNFCITAKKEWVEKNCPKLLTDYKEFLRYPEKYEDEDEEEEVYGRFGCHFLEWSEENFGITYDDEEY